MNTPLLGLVIYLAVILAVGAWTWRLNATKEDFILGGRRLGAWVIAFSERTAAESAWLILGLSGALYSVGMLEVWTIVGCVSGIVFSWLVVARKLRVVSEQVGAITLPEYFFRFCGEKAMAVRVVSMLIIAFFFSLYVAAQFVGAGKVLEITFGLGTEWGVPLAACVVVLYTMMGGFAAVCYTDVIQAALMVVTLVVLPVAGLIFLSSRGLDVGAAIAATGTTGSLTGGKVGWAGFAAVVGGLSWGLGYMGQPHLVTKFMAIDRPEAIRKGRAVAIVWTIVAYAGAALVGVVGIALVHYGRVSGATLGGEGGDPERALPLLAGFLLPAWVAGILVSGAVAAMMSTADSQLLVTTSTVVEDFYSRALGRSVSQKRLVALSRVMTLAIGAVAYVLAVTNTALIYKMVSYAWSGLGASFGPAILLSLHWRRMNATGVLAGMVTGAVSTVLWMEIPGLNDLLSVRFVAFFLATLAAVVGSLVARPFARGAPIGEAAVKAVSEAAARPPA